MDSNERNIFRELERMVEEISTYAELYEETDSWHVEGYEGPVNHEIAEYILDPADHFLYTWNLVDEAIGFDDSRRREYHDLQDQLFDNSDFIEEVYDLNKPLGSAKVEAKYR